MINSINTPNAVLGYSDVIATRDAYNAAAAGAEKLTGIRVSNGITNAERERYRRQQQARANAVVNGTTTFAEYYEHYKSVRDARALVRTTFTALLAAKRAYNALAVSK